MLRKPALFSSDPKHNEANRSWPRTAPNQYDPPEHTNFCLILNPWFSPGIVARRTEAIRDLSASLIDGVDRKSVVKGKSVLVRVDLGGAHDIKNKYDQHMLYKHKSIV